MVTYYAKARNVHGKIEQLLVTKEPGKATVPQWTGRIYKSDREADVELAKLNCVIACEPNSFERQQP